ncbi:hypothetical protein B0H19DRAFT_968302 [Mycena capillaripes]|nr:hypothetical protein B0H19DRAFT_968302 [Mycena capillaripes]
MFLIYEYTDSCLCLSASLIVNNGAVRQCGEVIQDSDLSMTISNAVWDGGAHCGKPATVQFQGRSVVLTIEGECAICIASGIEITEAGFTALGASERGPPTVNWEFN